MSNRRQLTCTEFTRDYYPEESHARNRPLTAKKDQHLRRSRPLSAAPGTYQRSSSVFTSIHGSTAQSGNLFKAGTGTLPQSGRPSTAVVSPVLWRSEYRANIGRAKSAVAFCREVQMENSRLCEETEKKTKSDQEFVENRLDKRLTEIQFWKTEVTKMLQTLKDDSTELKTVAERLKLQREKLQEPLELSLQCLKIREDRTDRELVDDEVLAALHNEQNTLTQLTTELEKAATLTLNQARKDLATSYQLRKEYESKSKTFDTDTITKDLLPTHSKMNSVQHISPSPISVEEWEHMCQCLLSHGQEQHKISVKIQNAMCDLLLTACRNANELTNKTNFALNRKIEETKHAKKELEDQRSRVIEEEQLLQKSRHELMAQLQAKKEPFCLALTRMRARSARPYREQTRDDAETALYRQIKALQSSIFRLQNAVLATEKAAERLASTKATLEQDIEEKTRTLLLDEVKVMPLRNKLKVDAF